MLWEGLRETPRTGHWRVNYSIKQQQSMLVTMSGILHIYYILAWAIFQLVLPPEFWFVALGVWTVVTYLLNSHILQII